MTIRTLALITTLLTATLSLAQTKPTIFVSIPPQAWLLDQLAGTLVTTETLLAPGANPHIFEPTPRQIRQLGSAALYLTIGFTFEEAIVSRSAKLNRNLKVLSMGHNIERLDDHHHHDHDHDHTTCQGSDGDPHYWLSPRHYATMASNTVAALHPLLPNHHQLLNTNLHQLTARITTLNTQINTALKELTSRTWLVYHPSWSYFAHDYNLKLLVIENDGKAPGARHLSTIIRQARPLGITTIYTEPQYDPKPAQTLAQQLNARVITLNPLQYDWPALMQEVTSSLAATPITPAEGEAK